MNRTSWMFHIVLLLPVLALIACSSQSADTQNDWSADAVARDAGTRPLSALLVNSSGSLALGPNRLAFGLFDRDGAMLHDAEEVSLTLVRIENDVPTETRSVSLQRSQLADAGHSAQHEQGPGAHGALATLYVAPIEFQQLDWWGAEISAKRAGKRELSTRILFRVSERGTGPVIGRAMPTATQRVLADVPELAAIDTANPPDPDFHQETVTAALQSGQPLVIAVATPRFCQTRFCGPVLEQAVAPVAERFRGRIRVLHIEPFDLAEANAGRLVPVPLMAEWGLVTEPWVFVVDRAGNVAAEFEGVVTEAELRAAVEPLVTR